MGEIISIVLDTILIGLLITSISFALRLHKQLIALRNSRSEMERFVNDFSTTVQRAEAGVRGLKQAARSSGDDLENLIEKAQKMHEELRFLIESADQLATRLTHTASSAARSSQSEAQAQRVSGSQQNQLKQTASATNAGLRQESRQAEARPASAAERELMQILEKIG